MLAVLPRPEVHFATLVSPAGRSILSFAPSGQSPSPLLLPFHVSPSLRVSVLPEILPCMPTSSGIRARASRQVVTGPVAGVYNAAGSFRSEPPTLRSRGTPIGDNMTRGLRPVVVRIWEFARIPNRAKMRG